MTIKIINITIIFLFDFCAVLPFLAVLTRILLLSTIRNEIIQLFLGFLQPLTNRWFKMILGFIASSTLFHGIFTLTLSFTLLRNFFMYLLNLLNKTLRHKAFINLFHKLYLFYRYKRRNSFTFAGLLEILFFIANPPPAFFHAIDNFLIAIKPLVRFFFILFLVVMLFVCFETWEFPYKYLKFDDELEENNSSDDDRPDNPPGGGGVIIDGTVLQQTIQYENNGEQEDENNNNGADGDNEDNPDPEDNNEDDDERRRRARHIDDLQDRVIRIQQQIEAQDTQRQYTHLYPHRYTTHLQEKANALFKNDEPLADLISHLPPQLPDQAKANLNTPIPDTSDKLKDPFTNISFKSPNDSVNEYSSDDIASSA